jgi:hypothetical protein
MDNKRKKYTKLGVILVNQKKCWTITIVDNFITVKSLILFEWTKKLTNILNCYQISIGSDFQI